MSIVLILHALASTRRGFSFSPSSSRRMSGKLPKTKSRVKFSANTAGSGTSSTPKDTEKKRRLNRVRSEPNFSAAARRAGIDKKEKEKEKEKEERKKKTEEKKKTPTRTRRTSSLHRLSDALQNNPSRRSSEPAQGEKDKSKDKEKTTIKQKLMAKEEDSPPTTAESGTSSTAPASMSSIGSNSRVRWPTLVEIKALKMRMETESDPDRPWRMQAPTGVLEVKDLIKRMSACAQKLQQTEDTLASMIEDLKNPNR